MLVNINCSLTVVNSFEMEREGEIDVRRKVAQWGKVKFQPKKLEKKPLFNVVARDARFVAPTPWSKYKDNWSRTQQEKEQEHRRPQMNSDEAQKFLRQREINYLRIRMQQKQQEPTEWESFEDDKTSLSSKETNGSKITEKQKNNKKSIRPIIDEDLLNNFDARKLSYEQRDKMRRILTKGVSLRRGANLKKAVNNLRYQKKLMENKKQKSEDQLGQKTESSHTILEPITKGIQQKQHFKARKDYKG